MGKTHILQLILLLWLTSEVISKDLSGGDDIPWWLELIPSHYSLELVLDPAASTYDGFIEIHFSAATSYFDMILLYASHETLEIQYALLNYKYFCDVTDHDNVTDIVTLTCPTGSFDYQGENTVTINFLGKFSTEELRGLYKSTYKENGEEYALLATQFEPVAARRAFPCFDGPKWKTTFDIFITHPNDYNVLSNTPVVKEFQVAPNQTQTQFDITPPMSSYLVAFVVSKSVTSSNNGDHVYDYKVFSRPSAKKLTNIATTYGPILIDLLSNWTNIDYKELGDAQAYQVSIPDLIFDAMENWGLITFREIDLLDEEENTSNYTKQRIITTIAHELAHQWFGNYVTINWWSDTWLNEGIATYFEYYIPDQLEDNLETMKQFVVEKLQPVLQVDATSLALPLSSDVDSAAEIDGKFDEISYSKGASVIRMLRNFLGETVFRESLQLYLRTYKYSNINSSLLLDCITVETAIGIEKVMDNWIYKSGFPLVTAKLNTSTVILTQETFTTQNYNDSEQTQWYIPISYTTSSEKNFNASIEDWLEPNSSLEIAVDNNSWIIVNLQQTGYYRVNYDDELWHRIINALNRERGKIDVLNRAQLIDDAFNIARTGRISYEIPFNLTNFLSSETNRILYWINKAFPPNHANFGSGHVDKLKEVLILDWACQVGQERCTIYAQESFQNYKTNHSLLDSNKRRTVFCYGLRNSSNPAEDYDFLFNLFKNSSSVVEQDDIISSLGCTTNTDLLAKYLSETIAVNSSLRKQDAEFVFKAVYTKSEAGVNVSLNFLETNFDNISAIYKGMNAVPNLIIGLSNRVSSDYHINKLTNIIKDNIDVEAIQLIGEKAIDVAMGNRNWTERSAAEIKKILQQPPSNAGRIPEPTLLLLIFLITILYLFIVLNTKLD